MYKTLPSHKTILPHTTPFTSNNQPSTPPYQSYTLTLNSHDQVTGQSKDTKLPLTGHTHNTLHPPHSPHIPSSPIPYYRIHSHITTKPIPDFTYTQFCPLLNCHYLITKINTHFPPKPIFYTILEYNNLSNPPQPHPYKHLTVNSAKTYPEKNPHIFHTLIFILQIPYHTKAPCLPTQHILTISPSPPSPYLYTSPHTITLNFSLFLPTYKTPHTPSHPTHHIIRNLTFHTYTYLLNFTKIPNTQSIPYPSIKPLPHTFISYKPHKNLSHTTSQPSPKNNPQPHLFQILQNIPTSSTSYSQTSKKSTTLFLFNTHITSWHSYPTTMW